MHGQKGEKDPLSQGQKEKTEDKGEQHSVKVLRWDQLGVFREEQEG